MGFRFFKRFQLAPGVTLNVSKGGASVSVGPRGAKVTVGSRGVQLTVGVPGTGLYWTGKLGDVFGSDDDRKSAAAAPSESEAPDKKAGPGERPEAELAWARGLEALDQERYSDAVSHLQIAWQGRERLRGARAKLTVSVPLTPEIELALVPDRKGAGLAYAEALQAAGRIDEAVAVLQALKTEADAPVVRAALAEIELSRGGAEAALLVCGRSRDPIVALYRARALLAAGRKRDAIAEAERAKAAAPDHLRDDFDEILTDAR